MDNPFEEAANWIASGPLGQLYNDLTGHTTANATMQVGQDTANALRYQADQNVSMQRETNAMQIDLANNAVQRRQEDLAKAGINPLLAGSQGGAQTPTLQAPQLSGLGEAAKASSPGQGELARVNGLDQGITMATKAMDLATNVATAIPMAFAQINKTTNEATKASADATYTNTQNDWYAPQAKSSMALQGEQGQETASRAEMQKAQTATINAIRQPEVNKVLQDTATSLAEAIKDGTETDLIKQQTNTEQAKTKTENAIADNAAKLYGAKASEAVTVAKTLGYKLVNELPTEIQQNIDIRDATLKIMQNEQTKGILDNILKNDYGRLIEWGKIPLAQQLGAAASGANKKIPNPVATVR